jgi:hypothetical protein
MLHLLERFFAILPDTPQLLEERPSLAPRDRAHDCDEAQRQKHPMRPMQPGERDARLLSCPSTEVTIQNEWLGNEQNEGEQQPYAHHRVHPPKRNHLKSIPKINTPRHVEAGQPDDDYCRSCLPDKAVLDRLKGLQPVFAQVAVPHCRQYDGRCHGNTADPDHNGEDMQGSGENDVIHDRSGRGVVRRALDNANALWQRAEAERT